MVIETFKNQDAQAIYRRVNDQGRILPDGLQYIDSWVEASFHRCFQLMECTELPSRETQNIMRGHLEAKADL